MSWAITGSRHSRHAAAPHHARRKYRMIARRRKAGTGSRPRRFGA